VRAPPPPADPALIAAQYEAAPGTQRLRELKDSFAAASPETVVAILEEAVKLASDHLVALNDVGDAQGCILVDGRVKTAPGHREAWAAFADGGWPTLDLPEEEGGQGLPAALAFSVQEVLDRACPAFGMIPVPTRSAARMIHAFASEELRAEWMPKLASGEWVASICISEVDAGSDVMRMRTRATPDGDGSWSITGEKQWISFGDHDLAPRIGHCILAKTATAEGLSLFLLPDSIDGARQPIVVRRLEEKMGLHASPTCAMGFEGAKAWLIGEEGRGLQQMFVMITNMRLATGAQGLGIASGAADVALNYAAERRQGGRGATPVTIDNHADVQRMLLDMAARVETLRGLVIAAANQVDLANHETDPQAKADAAALLQWLLPIVKTSGGDVAFEVSSAAIQVLGGAGYTREWPVEQCLRDARVLTIFEGTSGIQALDIVHRRVRRDGSGLACFLKAARADCAAGDSLAQVLDLLEHGAASIAAEQDPGAVDGGATAFLRLAQLAASGWIAARLAGLDSGVPAQARLVAAGRHWLAGLPTRAALAHAESRLGGAMIEGFAALRLP
jgi:alkylation response protein AidB-like acyl-CoA dehydrogenase